MQEAEKNNKKINKEKSDMQNSAPNGIQEKQIGPTEIASWIREADMLLVGLGGEFSGSQSEILTAYNDLKKLLKEKNFFIITSNTDGAIHKEPVFSMLSAAPCEKDADEKQWNSYMNWISCTLGKKLVILELGEDFSNPQLMRWPFEKMTMINQKAHLIRAGEQFFQIPKELKDRAVSVPIHAKAFLKTLLQKL